MRRITADCCINQEERESTGAGVLPNIRQTVDLRFLSSSHHHSLTTIVVDLNIKQETDSLQTCKVNANETHFSNRVLQ